MIFYMLFVLLPDVVVVLLFVTVFTGRGVGIETVFNPIDVRTSSKNFDDNSTCHLGEYFLDSSIFPASILSSRYECMPGCGVLEY